MGCVNCKNDFQRYGFNLKVGEYYMTQVDEIKKCCPSKVKLTDYTATKVTYVADANGKEYTADRKEFMKTSWRIYDSY